jgi:hypothetical protein
MAIDVATSKDSDVAALCQQIVAIVAPTPGTLVATTDGALYDDIAQRERSGCLMNGRWDGGDISDSTYVPLDVYQMTILCTRLEGKDPPPKAK